MASPFQFPLRCLWPLVITTTNCSNAAAGPPSVVPPLALAASDDGFDEEGGAVEGGDMFSEIAIVSSWFLASSQWRADYVLDETLVRRARTGHGACACANAMA